MWILAGVNRQEKYHDKILNRSLTNIASWHFEQIGPRWDWNIQLKEKKITDFVQSILNCLQNCSINHQKNFNKKRWEITVVIPLEKKHKSTYQYVSKRVFFHRSHQMTRQSDSVKNCKFWTGLKTRILSLLTRKSAVMGRRVIHSIPNV